MPESLQRKSIVCMSTGVDRTNLMALAKLFGITPEELLKAELEKEEYIANSVRIFVEGIRRK